MVRCQIAEYPIYCSWMPEENCACFLPTLAGLDLCYGLAMPGRFGYMPGGNWGWTMANARKLRIYAKISTVY
jgi:hypothetical protein